MKSCEYFNLPESGFVIFGASGDLSGKKLFPSFYGLWRKKIIKNNFFIIGFARSDYDDFSFRKKIGESIKKFYKNYSDNEITEFINHCYYLKGNYDNIKNFYELKNFLNELNKKFNTNSNIIYHLATPPEVFMSIITNLGETELIKKSKIPFNRILVEKPFGLNRKNSEELNKKLKEFVDEEQIFRVDHYLGKSTVQNILVFRFANNLFNNLWDNRYIEKIIIKFKEKEGVENRGGYFDKTGLLRDIFQNHILQLITLIFMEKPKVYTAEEIQKNKEKVLSSIIPFRRKDIFNQILFAQYKEGVIDGNFLKGYREETGISRKSCTETFIAARIFLNDEKFKNIPIYVIAGKRMDNTESKIEIYFKKVKKCIFCQDESFHTNNKVIFNIKPEQGLEFDFLVKTPGSKTCLESAKIKLRYEDIFKSDIIENYESVISESLLGDKSIFWSEKALYYSWTIIEAVLKKLEKCSLNERQNILKFYNAGTEGPEDVKKFFN